MRFACNSVRFGINLYAYQGTFMNNKIISLLFILIVLALPLSAAQVSQEEAKKLAAQQQSQSLYHYLQASAATASRRIKSLLEPKKLHLLTTSFLLGNFLKTICYEKLGYELNPIERLVSAGGGIFGVCTYDWHDWMESLELKDAIEKKNIEKIRKILKQGSIDLNRKPGFHLLGREGELPIITALLARNPSPEIVKLLLQYGARRFSRDNFYISQHDFDLVQIEATDSPEVQNNKREIQQLLRLHARKQEFEKKYKQARQEQQNLKTQYEPTELVAESALEALHEIGQIDVLTDTIKSYMTPGYVARPTKLQIEPEKKQAREKQD